MLMWKKCDILEGRNSHPFSKKCYKLMSYRDSQLLCPALLESDVFCFFSSVFWKGAGCTFHELPYVHMAFIKTPSQTECGRKSGPGSDGLWAEPAVKPDLALHVDRQQHCDAQCPDGFLLSIGKT